MSTTGKISSETPLPNRFAAEDVRQILEECGWLTREPSAEQIAWCESAAALLGPQAEDRSKLADLLALVFGYDAREILATVDAQVVLSRFAARDVVRQLALLLLENGPLNSDRLKEIVAALKERLDLRGRELFHPLRLVLAGRAGEGELDRVILLLDAAAAAEFAANVKSARQRVLEFCAALD
jgi:nondiscriminating glutamyl-tRNA synthetase